MRIDVVTLFPEMFDAILGESILQRAQNKGLVEICTHNLREYAQPTGNRRNVDDYAFGGGAGMVIGIEPIAKCFSTLEKERQYEEKIYLSPDGDMMKQGLVNQLSLKKNLLLLCGRYKGVDQRVRDHLITREISIGDFVLSGGEIPACVLIDAMVRVIPGVLSDESSALLDSFQGDLLDAPVYTRPADFQGWKVPDVLLSGHEAKIEEWRYQQALQKTQERRPDLLGED